MLESVLGEYHVAMADESTGQDPATPQSAFGENLREARQARGMSQTEFVDFLADKGVPMHRQTLHKIETDARPLKLDEAVAIAEALSLDMKALLRSPDGFKLDETSRTIAQVMNECVMNLGRLYELQKEFARLSDRQGVRWRDPEDPRLVATAKDIHEQLIMRMHASRDPHPKMAESGLWFPDYHALTVLEVGELGENTRRFIEAHPELRRPGKLSDSSERLSDNGGEGPIGPAS